MKKITHGLSVAAVAVSMLTFTPALLFASPATGTGLVPVGHFLSMAEGKPWAPLPPHIAEETRAGMAREQARIYMAGVIDSGEGGRWCVGDTGMPPHEVEKRLVSRLSDQAAVEPEIKGGNAARRIIILLEEEFPCSL